MGLTLLRSHLPLVLSQEHRQFLGHQCCPQSVKACLEMSLLSSPSPGDDTIIDYLESMRMLLETHLWLHCSSDWRAVIEYPNHWILAKKLPEAACCDVLHSMGMPRDALALFISCHEFGAPSVSMPPTMPACATAAMCTTWPPWFFSCPRQPPAWQVVTRVGNGLPAWETPGQNCSSVEKGVFLNPEQGLASWAHGSQESAAQSPQYQSSLLGCLDCNSSKAWKHHEREKDSWVHTRVLRDGSEEQEQSWPC